MYPGYVGTPHGRVGLAVQARRWPAWIVAFTLVFSLFLSIGGTTVYAEDEGADQSVNTGAVTNADETGEGDEDGSGDGAGTSNEGEGNTTDGEGEGDTGGGEGEGDTGNGGEGNTGDGEGEGNTGDGEGEGNTSDSPGIQTADEEVGIAAAATFSIFSTDGAVFQIRDSTGTTVVDGPATVTGGSATFTVEDPGTYVIELVSAPLYYQLAGDSIGHFGGDNLLNPKPFSELASGWTVTFEQIPNRQFTIFTNVNGAVFNILDANGDPIDSTLFPGLTGITVNGSATVIVPAAPIRLQLVSRPAGYQLSGDSVFHFENNNTTGEISGESWSVTFAQIPTREFTLRTFDATSGSNVPMDGAVYNILDAAGNPIDATDFPGLTGVTTSGGSVVLTVPDAAIRIQLVTRPAGYQLTGDSVFHFENGGTTAATTASDWSVTFAQIPSRQFTLRSFDATTASYQPLDGAVFNILDAAGNAIDASDFPGLTGVTTSGGSVALTVPDAPIRIQLISSPANYELTGDSVFHFQNGGVTDPIGTGTSDWSVLFAQITGNLEVNKWFCLVDDEASAGVDFNTPAYGAQCETSIASFELYYGANYVDTITTDFDGTASVTGLLAGSYTIVEISTDAAHNFTIEAGETTTVNVTNYVYLSGKVKVTKYFCPDKKDRTKIFVEYPLMLNGGYDGPDIGKKCWTGKADFEIWLYGDSDNAISFSTGKKGTAWLTLPITTSDTGPHTIVEVDTGKSATFEVFQDEKTDITVVNKYKKKPHHHHDKPHKHHKPGKDDTVEVDTLPSTGTGSTMNSDAFFFAAGSMILFGLGVATTRRRWLQ